jgi:hypothetical protein
LAAIMRRLKRRIPAIRERYALRDEVGGLREEKRRLEERLDHERLFPLEWANRRVRDRIGDEVQSGPFAGMRYPDWGLTQVDLFAPKVLGIYERELHAAVERLIARSPSLVVNVGAGDGYYAVGLARRLPDARVVAFEPGGLRREQLVGIADLNGVASRIEVVPAICERADLEQRLGERSALLCDCDGCEARLLDPASVPQLRHVPMIVEAHDLLVEGITRTLEHAFEASHEIRRIEAETRFVDDYPKLDFMPLVTRQLAISEFRGAPMWWLEMTPRAGNS